MKKGFTLLELLIVIGILSILTTVVAFTLNPGQLLAQARDSQRLSDLSSINAAIGLYVASVDSPSVLAGPYQTTAGTGPFSGATVSTSTVITGSGWVPINFSNIPSGSPLSRLPLDPTNSGNYFYAYKGDATNYTVELDARLESNKYRTLMTSDGGSANICTGSYVDSTCWYEIGTDPGLDL